MSKISVYGLESGNRPYVHIQGTDIGSYVNLGVKVFLGQRLPQFLGVNMDLARAEADSIESHNVFEIYMSNTDKPSINIAVLGLITNILMPKELQHVHSQAASIYPQPVYIAEARHYGLKGLSELTEHISSHGELYKGNGEKYTQNLSHLGTMLHHPQPNARNWQVSEDGIIKPIK